MAWNSKVENTLQAYGGGKCLVGVIRSLLKLSKCDIIMKSKTLLNSDVNMYNEGNSLKFNL